MTAQNLQAPLEREAETGDAEMTSAPPLSVLPLDGRTDSGPAWFSECEIYESGSTVLLY